MALNDLFQSLQMFQAGAQELATGRAIRSASEQANQINMQEGKEFEKRQQFQQLGQGLAAQLSALGASPQQVQQMSQNYMPQQLNGPQDFFQQAAMAKSPAAQQEWQKAGQNIQKGLASAPMSTFQNEQIRLQKYALLNERLAAANRIVKDEDLLSLADKKTIETLASKQGGKLSITNNLQQLADMWQGLTPTERLQQGKEIMKTLNSAEGADAVGSEEVKRLGSKLEFAFGNFTNGNELQAGRDLEGFYSDLLNSTGRLQRSVEANDASIARIYKKYGKEMPVLKQTRDNFAADDELKVRALEKFNGLSPEQEQRLLDVKRVRMQREPKGKI